MKTLNKTLDFTLKGEYIELNKLMKYLGIAESGADAGQIISEGNVLLNGEKEYRKRAKIRYGDILEVMGVKIVIYKT